MRAQCREEQFMAPSPYDAPTVPIDVEKLRLWWAMKQNLCTEIPTGDYMVTE